MDEQDEVAGHVVQGFNPIELFSKVFTVGSADLIHGGGFREIVGRSVSAMLLHLHDKNGSRYFKQATIVLPPTTVTKHTEESVFAALIQATVELRGFDFDAQEEPILRRLVCVVHSQSLEITDLMQVVRAQKKRCLIAIADASLYQDPSLDLSASFGVSAIRIAEDHWAPHVASTCRMIVSIVKELEGNALVHVPEVPAQKPVNVELLHSIDDCYVTSAHYPADPEETFNSRAQALRSMVLQGRLSEVMSEVEALALPYGVQLFAIAQLLRGTGRDSEMLKVIAQLQPHLATLKAEASIQVARLAHMAGDDDLAQEILPEGPDGIRDQLWIEEGLQLATHFEDNKRIARFDAQLSELFPHSERLRENRDRRLLMNSLGPTAGNPHLFTTAGFTSHHLILTERLSAPEPDYSSAIETAREWGQDWLELTVVCCAMHAQSVGKPRDAANAASFVTASERYGRQATQVLLWSIRSMMLKELIPEDEHDYYRPLLQTAFRFLARYPEDGDVRSGLTALLSVESCGDMGIPLVALTMLDLAQKGVGIARSNADTSEDRSRNPDEAIQTSLKNGFMWLGNLGACEPGVTVIPRELIVADPDDVVRTIERMEELTRSQDSEDVDLEFMKKLVLLGCAICPHAAQERDEDIRMMGRMAGQFALEKQFQQARDYAEQILLMGQSSDYRRRLAWQTFADVYHRCNNHVIALVGLACALSLEVRVERADLWHEVYAIHRVLRDLGLLELARSFLPTMERLLTDLGFDAANDPRYVAAELSLRLFETDADAVHALGELLADAAQACRLELGDRNRLLPLAVLLGQSALKATNAGITISGAVQETLDAALVQVGISMADMIRTVSAARPAAEDVLAMFNSVEPAAFASDVARDFTVLEMAARRLLDTGQGDELAAGEMAFAVELLADHTIACPGDVPAMTLEWPIRYAERLNQAGLDVAFLAIDGTGELTVTLVSGGQVRVVEQPKHEQSFRRRFLVWLQDYPKGYGHVERSEGNNIFYTSMERLDVRLPHSDKLVLVAEPFLQQLTANLVVVLPEEGGLEYLAGTKMAIGVVPSLGWFSSTGTATRNSQTAYKAWISADRSSEFGEAAEVMPEDGAGQEELAREPTLDIALKRLSGCFEDFGFVVDNGRRLPRDLKDAALAVVTAHGGLNSEGQYLHSIRDDRDLVEAPSSLALALAGIELVILFVCSGGRIAKSPWDNSTTSLPKQLLNKGSRAVIASPWPLNVAVTYNWLEPFLREWEKGTTVLDATKIANDTVAQRLGDVPQYSLAMCVYGDVLLTKSAVGRVSTPQLNVAAPAEERTHGPLTRTDN